MKWISRLVVMVIICECLSVIEAQAISFSTTCKLSWTPNTESDLAGYRAWADKGGVQKPILNIPVNPTPNVSCAQLGIDTDGIWNFNVIAYDNAQIANLSSVASIVSTKDTVAPDTSIVPTVTGSNVSFALTSNETGVTFECALDTPAFTQCTTPRVYTGLSDGAHTFLARAKDAANNIDASQASSAWTINVQAPAQPSGLTVTPNFP